MKALTVEGVGVMDNRHRRPIIETKGRSYLLPYAKVRRRSAVARSAPVTDGSSGQTNY